MVLLSGFIVFLPRRRCRLFRAFFPLDEGLQCLAYYFAFSAIDQMSKCRIAGDYLSFWIGQNQTVCGVLQEAAINVLCVNIQNAIPKPKRRAKTKPEVLKP